MISTYWPRFSIVLHVHCIPALITPFHITMLAMLVKQRSELWLPVNLTEPWTDSVFLSVLLKTGLRRSKCIIGWIIAGILSLISTVTVGTLSGTALHNSIQNHDFITAWHKDSHDLWT